jgi:hypothetical protein
MDTNGAPATFADLAKQFPDNSPRFGTDFDGTPMNSGPRDFKGVFTIEKPDDSDVEEGRNPIITQPNSHF